jgi:hypothetical protein
MSTLKRSATLFFVTTKRRDAESSLVPSSSVSSSGKYGHLKQDHDQFVNEEVIKVRVFRDVC